MLLSSLVGDYGRFRATFCHRAFFYLEDGGGMCLRNVETVTHYTVSQCRQPECERKMHQLGCDIFVYPMEDERPQTDRQTLSVPMFARLSACLTSRSVKLFRRICVPVPTATENWMQLLLQPLSYRCVRHTMQYAEVLQADVKTKRPCLFPVSGRAPNRVHPKILWNLLRTLTNMYGGNDWYSDVQALRLGVSVRFESSFPVWMFLLL
jgi:hypothetical protein